MKPKGIWIRTEHWNVMHQDVERHLPDEACGLVAGLGDHSVGVFPITNTHKSPTRFRMDPHEQIRVFTYLEEQELDLLAIYHSHPNGPPIPSPTDLEEAAYPDALNLIWSFEKGTWLCRAFSIREGGFNEVPVFRIP